MGLFAVRGGRLTMRSNRIVVACKTFQNMNWRIRSHRIEAIVIASILCTLMNHVSSAQIKPEIRDRIIPAAVQIVVVGEATIDGVSEPIPFFQGSGTIVSSDGLILTNWHVVDMQSHRVALEAWEDEAVAAGGSLSVDLLDEAVLVLVSDGEGMPVPRYFAEIVASDPTLDLAVLDISAIITSESIQTAPPNLSVPFVPIGNSDDTGLGDPIDIFGFPGISGGALTYTEGVVSGFLAEEIQGRAWILTDATISGGSSGGTAVDRNGELIGVPTQGAVLDCRPGDTNSDGQLDARDVGCIPTGGSIGQLRPINLAREILQEAGWSQQSPGSPLESPVPIPTSTPTPTPTSIPTPRIAPTATATPRPLPTRTPVPTPTPMPFTNFPLLPDRLALPHSLCFSVENDGVFKWPEIVARLSGAPNPEQRLRDWGWETGVYRTFGCDGPPDGEVGWVEVNVHRFADATSAQEAVDYFAAARAAGLPLVFADSPVIGDHAVALTGPASNGKEFTIYASQGPHFVRVTGVSPSGIPFMNVLAVTQDVLALNQDGSQSSSTSTNTEPDLPRLSASTFLPSYPSVNYADCFRIIDEGTYSYSDMVGALQQRGLSQAQAEALGWTDGAYIVFSCDEAPVGRATQLDVVIHQWADTPRALEYFSQSNELGENESRACDSARTLVVCVFGRSATGSPLSDVHFLLNQVIASIP